MRPQQSWSMLHVIIQFKGTEARVRYNIPFMTWILRKLYNRPKPEDLNGKKVHISILSITQGQTKKKKEYIMGNSVNTKNILSGHLNRVLYLAIPKNKFFGILKGILFLGEYGIVFISFLSKKKKKTHQYSLKTLFEKFFSES